MNGAIEEQVRQRAYEIWVALGRTEGQAQDHWFAAEQDLMGLPETPKKARAVRPKAAPKTEAEKKMSRARSAKVSKTRN